MVSCLSSTVSYLTCLICSIVLSRTLAEERAVLIPEMLTKIEVPRKFPRTGLDCALCVTEEHNKEGQPTVESARLGNYE